MVEVMRLTPRHRWRFDCDCDDYYRWGFGGCWPSWADSAQKPGCRYCLIFYGFYRKGQSLLRQSETVLQAVWTTWRYCWSSPHRFWRPPSSDYSQNQASPPQLQSHHHRNPRTSKLITFIHKTPPPQRLAFLSLPKKQTKSIVYYLTLQDDTPLYRFSNMNTSLPKRQEEATRGQSLITQPQSQGDDLVIPDKFTYEFFQTNRYSISESGNYEALCNNGWIKLYTKLCRVYWHTQNEFSHEVHDWKFHISVKHKHLKKAWNLLVALFIKMQCRAGMKTIYLKQSQRPQNGREITIYLIKYDPKFKDSGFAGDFGLNIAVEHSEEYWLTMCRKIQQYLASYSIESNGLADGDFPLGKYVSLRNQAFIHNQRGESVYPPNNAGWNPLKYELPINLERFKNLHIKEEEELQTFFSRNKKYFLGLAFVTTVVLVVLRYKSKPIKLLGK